MAISNDDFMDDSLYAISLRGKLALLDRPLDEDVVPFLKARRNAGKVAIERKAVPIGVLLRFAFAVLVSVALPEAHIRDGCSGKEDI